MEVSAETRAELYQVERAQILRVARMRYGVVWAFIFVSIARGIYEIARHQGMEHLMEGLLRGVVPAVLLALLGFPLVTHFTKRAERELDEKYRGAPARSRPSGSARRP